MSCLLCSETAPQVPHHQEVLPSGASSSPPTIIKQKATSEEGIAAHSRPSFLPPCLPAPCPSGLVRCSTSATRWATCATTRYRSPTPTPPQHARAHVLLLLLGLYVCVVCPGAGQAERGGAGEAQRGHHGARAAHRAAAGVPLDRESINMPDAYTHHLLLQCNSADRPDRRLSVSLPACWLVVVCVVVRCCARASTTALR